MNVRNYMLNVEITDDCADWNAACAQAAIDLGCMIERNQIRPHMMKVDEEISLYCEAGAFTATFTRTE